MWPRAARAIVCVVVRGDDSERTPGAVRPPHRLRGSSPFRRHDTGNRGQSPLLSGNVASMRRLVCSAAVFTLGLCGTAAADPVATVEARGNIVTGGLEFAPNASAVQVGDELAWINKDFLVPHTVVERHGLWRLEGTYGG